VAGSGSLLPREPGEVIRQAGPFAYMMGHGGQIAYLLPGQDAIVVRFGAQAQLLHSTLYEVLAP
jgi:hypothetical protein